MSNQLVLRAVAVGMSCGLFSLAVLAQATPAAPDAKRAEFSKTSPMSASTVSPTGACPVDCLMKVAVTEDTQGNCTATIDGYLKIPTGKNPKIVWELDPFPSSSLGVSYEFHAEAGIIIISDPNNQLKPNGGGLGGGPPGPTDAKKFHFKKHNNNKRSTLTDHPLRYFPIVIRKQLGEYTMCNSVDPVIINDGG